MERPEWSYRDSLRSIKDIGSLVLDTIVNLLPLDTEIIVDEVKPVREVE